VEPWQFADRCTRTARADFWEECRGGCESDRRHALARAGGDGGGGDGAGRRRDGGPATSAELGLPEATVTDAAGDLLISDTGSSRIREVAG
jgi:hypothetical protein